MDYEILEKALFKTIEGVYVGEYSPEQGCYNVCSLSEMLNTNRNHMKKNTFTGYIPICIGSEDDVYEELDKFKAKYGRPNPTENTRPIDYIEKNYSL